MQNTRRGRTKAPRLEETTTVQPLVKDTVTTFPLSIEKLNNGDPYATIESMYITLSTTEKELTDINEECKVIRNNIQKQEATLKILGNRQEKLTNEFTTIKARIDIEREKLKKQHQDTLQQLRENLEKSKIEYKTKN